MKKNLLPDMQQVKVNDKNGVATTLSIEVRRGEKSLYVFLADSNQLGNSRLAQDAVHFFEKICQRLNLDQTQTTFYRHIFQDQMGSLFGRYKVDWAAEEGPSYRFQMLTNIDDLNSIKKILNATVKVNLADLVSKQAANA